MVFDSVWDRKVCRHMQPLKSLGIKRVVPSRRPIIALQVAVELLTEIARSTAQIEGAVPRCLAPLTTIDQPDVDLSLVCIQAKSVTGDKTALLPALQAVTEQMWGFGSDDAKVYGLSGKK